MVTTEFTAEGLTCAWEDVPPGPLASPSQHQRRAQVATLDGTPVFRAGVR